VTMNSKKPRTIDFEIPDDFRLDEHLHHQDWDLPVHDPMEVTLHLDPSLAPLRERLFPRSRVNAAGTELKITVRNDSALVRQVLALGPRARVVSPPELRQRAIELLRRLHASVAEPELGA
jgi:predicted DNA-binding transcriptional regulator YafY